MGGRFLCQHFERGRDNRLRGSARTVIQKRCLLPNKSLPCFRSSTLLQKLSIPSYKALLHRYAAISKNPTHGIQDRVFGISVLVLSRSEQLKTTSIPDTISKLAVLLYVRIPKEIIVSKACSSLKSTRNIKEEEEG